MAVQVMTTHAQAAFEFASRCAQRFAPFACSSGAGNRVRASVPSSRALVGGQFVTKLATETPSSSKRKRMVVSVLEEPRVVDLQTSSLNETEKLLGKLGGMGVPNDTDLSRMNEAADRLFLWDDIPKLAKKQTFLVYELNEFDRDSPAYLELSRLSVNKIDPDTGAHIHALGDQVPYSNKQKVAAWEVPALCQLNSDISRDASAAVQFNFEDETGRHSRDLLAHEKPSGTRAPELRSLAFFTPDHYEGIMSWYFGDMGHISGMGPFINFQDTLFGIKGGTGFFAEARGVVRLHPITPFKFLYTFTLSGIPELPKLVTQELVAPHFEIEAHPDALDCKPEHALPNYTD